MKYLQRKIFIALLFLSFAFNAKAVNDTLTIGQVFDWKVGDTLMYRTQYTYSNGGCQQVTSNGGIIGFNVINRSNFQDSIIYQIHLFSPDTTVAIVINNIDSPILTFRGINCPLLYVKYGDVTLHTCWGTETASGCKELNDFYMYGVTNGPPMLGTNIDSSLFNFRINHFSLTFFEWGYNLSFEEKLGFRYARYWDKNFWSGPHGGGCGINLIYYKSDSITWVDSVLYTYNRIQELISTSFHLSPNPANETITLSAETETASEPLNVLVYDITGACVRNIQPNSIRSLTIPVNDLSPGYYVIKVSNGNHHLAAKGFIIAR